MKTAIIYYSLDGHCKKFSKDLNKIIPSKLIELKTKKKMPKNLISKYAYCSFLAMKNHKSILEPYEFSNNFEHIIIVSPVWVGKLPPAFNTFFHENTLNCKITLVLSCFVEYDFIIKNLMTKKLKGSAKIENHFIIYDREPRKYKTIQLKIKKYLSKYMNKQEKNDSELDAIF